MIHPRVESSESRRRFLKGFLLGAAIAPFLGFLRSRGEWVGLEQAWAASPLPAGQNAVSESDPVAKAIGYKANKKDVDAKKYPQILKPVAKNQKCDNCALYVKSNEGWGKCQMITSGVVAAGGWCGSWQPKKA